MAKIKRKKNITTKKEVKMPQGQITIKLNKARFQPILEFFRAVSPCPKNSDSAIVERSIYFCYWFMNCPQNCGKTLQECVKAAKNIKEDSTLYFTFLKDYQMFREGILPLCPPKVNKLKAGSD